MRVEYKSPTKEELLVRQIEGQIIRGFEEDIKNGTTDIRILYHPLLKSFIGCIELDYEYYTPEDGDSIENVEFELESWAAVE